MFHTRLNCATNGGKMWASPSVSRVGYECNWHLGLALMFVISAHKLRHGYLWDTANFILSWLKKKLVLPRAHKKDRGLSSVTGSEKASFANLLLNHFLPKAPLFQFHDEANVGDAKQTPPRCRWMWFKTAIQTVRSLAVWRWNCFDFMFVFIVCNVHRLPAV